MALYKLLLSGNVSKDLGEAGRQIIPPASSKWAEYEAWVEAGGVPDQEDPPTNEALRDALHTENYRLAKAKFEELTRDYHPTETVEWERLEAECRVYQADPIPANIGPIMQGEIDMTIVLGGSMTAGELVNRVIPKADGLRTARFAIVAKRHKNRQEIDALQTYGDLTSYNLQYDGLGF